MSATSALFKLFGCATIAFGLTSSPYVFSPSELIPKTKKRKSMTLGKTNSGENRLSLSSISNVEKLLNGSETKLTFQQLGMKWGEQKLTENDILFSPCQRGNYYLMKHHGGFVYKLDDGTTVNVPPLCRDTNKYGHLKHVKLGWPKLTSGPLTLSLITVGSCSLFRVGNLQGVQKSELQIECRDYLRDGNIVRGKYEDDSYEYE